jgi:hypothetical protein
LKRSDEVKKLSDDFVETVSNHAKVIQKYEKQKALCQNLEDSYNSENETDPDVLLFQQGEVNSCMIRANKISINFSLIDQDFRNIQKKITKLEKFAKADRKSSKILESQLDTVKAMLVQKQKQVKMKKNNFNDTYQMYQN